MNPSQLVGRRVELVRRRTWRERLFSRPWRPMERDEVTASGVLEAVEVIEGGLSFSIYGERLPVDVAGECIVSTTDGTR